MSLSPNLCRLPNHERQYHVAFTLTGRGGPPPGAQPHGRNSGTCCTAPTGCLLSGNNSPCPSGPAARRCLLGRPLHRTTSRGADQRNRAHPGVPALFAPHEEPVSVWDVSKVTRPDDRVLLVETDCVRSASMTARQAAAVWGGSYDGKTGLLRDCFLGIGLFLWDGRAIQGFGWIRSGGARLRFQWHCGLCSARDGPEWPRRSVSERITTCCLDGGVPPACPSRPSPHSNTSMTLPPRWTIRCSSPVTSPCGTGWSGGPVSPSVGSRHPVEPEPYTHTIPFFLDASRRRYIVVSIDPAGGGELSEEVFVIRRSGSPITHPLPLDVQCSWWRTTSSAC